MRKAKEYCIHRITRFYKGMTELYTKTSDLPSSNCLSEVPCGRVCGGVEGVG